MLGVSDSELPFRLCFSRLLLFAHSPCFLFHDEQQLKMPPSGQDELEYLKSLAKRLQAKINDLEQKAKSGPPSATPAPTTPELRMVLMGPPGAGQYPHHSRR